MTLERSQRVHVVTSAADTLAAAWRFRDRTSNHFVNGSAQTRAQWNRPLWLLPSSKGVHEHRAPWTAENVRPTRWNAFTALWVGHSTRLTLPDELQALAGQCRQIPAPSPHPCNRFLRGPCWQPIRVISTELVQEGTFYSLFVLNPSHRPPPPPHHHHHHHTHTHTQAHGADKFPKKHGRSGHEQPRALFSNDTGIMGINFMSFGDSCALLVRTPSPMVSSLPTLRNAGTSISFAPHGSNYISDRSLFSLLSHYIRQRQQGEFGSSTASVTSAVFSRAGAFHNWMYLFGTRVLAGFLCVGTHCTYYTSGVDGIVDYLWPVFHNNLVQPNDLHPLRVVPSQPCTAESMASVNFSNHQHVAGLARWWYHRVQQHWCGTLYRVRIGNVVALMTEFSKLGCDPLHSTRKPARTTIANTTRSHDGRIVWCVWADVCYGPLVLAPVTYGQTLFPMSSLLSAIIG